MNQRYRAVRSRQSPNTLTFVERHQQHLVQRARVLVLREYIEQLRNAFIQRTVHCITEQVCRVQGKTCCLVASHGSQRCKHFRHGKRLVRSVRDCKLHRNGQSHWLRHSKLRCKVRTQVLQRGCNLHWFIPKHCPKSALVAHAKLF